MPLRVLEAFEPEAGGVPEHVRKLATGLAERGHHVTVSGPPGAAVRDRLAGAAVSYRDLPWHGGVPSPSDPAVLRGLGALLREGRFDVVHAHAQKAGLLARPAARRAGVPALYSPHAFVYRTQLLLPRRGRRPRYLFGRTLERALGRRTDLLVAVSRDERDAAVRDGIVPPERVRVVEHGVAPDTSARPDPELLEFRRDGPLLGMVTNLRNQKGLPTVLDALELLRERGRPVRFAIVGDGPLRDYVAGRLRGPLAETTLLKPYGGAVEPHLAALDGFVLPSLWEGMSIALLEAMAMGLPAVASAVGGSPEALDNGRTGLLVPPEDPPALAAALWRLATEPVTRQELGRAAREQAERRFAVPRMIDELEASYRALAG